MMQWLRDLKRPLDKVKIDSLYTMLSIVTFALGRTA